MGNAGRFRCASDRLAMGVMIELNDENGAARETHAITMKIMEETDGTVYGCEMGVAWGGGIERIGRRWKGRGEVWGFDTFEGHPKHLAEVCEETIAAGGMAAHAAYCMDAQYDRYKDPYSYEYIRKNLDAQLLDNVHLVKGLVTGKTDISFIPHLNYVLLDMDFPLSMRNGYTLVKDKIVSGGYLCLHDVVPHGHIAGLYELYREIMESGMWELVSENHQTLLAVLRKK